MQICIKTFISIFYALLQILALQFATELLFISLDPFRWQFFFFLALKIGLNILGKGRLLEKLNLQLDYWCEWAGAVTGRIVVSGYGVQEIQIKPAEFFPKKYKILTSCSIKNSKHHGTCSGRALRIFIKVCGGVGRGRDICLVAEWTRGCACILSVCAELWSAKSRLFYA